MTSANRSLAFNLSRINAFPIAPERTTDDKRSELENSLGMTTKKPI
jgi:hypothetical protein